MGRFVLPAGYQDKRGELEWKQRTRNLLRAAHATQDKLSPFDALHAEVVLSIRNAGKFSSTLLAAAAAL